MNVYDSDSESANVALSQRLYFFDIQGVQARGIQNYMLMFKYLKAL
jgi:hypothetical protein